MEPYPDFVMLAESIRLCDMAYETDDARARKAFQDAGYIVLGRYSDYEAQAVALLDHTNEQLLVISGTRVSEGNIFERIVDVTEDLAQLLPPDQVGVNAFVASGCHMRANRIWDHLGPVFNPLIKIKMMGHSLGADTTHVMPTIMPKDMIQGLIAWEPPKAASIGYWTGYGWPNPNYITVINGHDWWAAWPWNDVNFQDLTHPLGPVLWLHDGTWEWITADKWQGDRKHSSDHDSAKISSIVAALRDSTHG